MFKGRLSGLFAAAALTLMSVVPSFGQSNNGKPAASSAIPTSLTIKKNNDNRPSLDSIAVKIAKSVTAGWDESGPEIVTVDSTENKYADSIVVKTVTETRIQAFCTDFSLLNLSVDERTALEDYQREFIQYFNGTREAAVAAFAEKLQGLVAEHTKDLFPSAFPEAADMNPDSAVTVEVNPGYQDQEPRNTGFHNDTKDLKLNAFFDAINKNGTALNGLDFDLTLKTNITLPTCMDLVDENKPFYAKMGITTGKQLQTYLNQNPQYFDPTDTRYNPRDLYTQTLQGQAKTHFETIRTALYVVAPGKENTTNLRRNAIEAKNAETVREMANRLDREGDIYKIFGAIYDAQGSGAGNIAQVGRSELSISDTTNRRAVLTGPAANAVDLAKRKEELYRTIRDMSHFYGATGTEAILNALVNDYKQNGRSTLPFMPFNQAWAQLNPSSTGKDGRLANIYLSRPIVHARTTEDYQGVDPNKALFGNYLLHTFTRDAKPVATPSTVTATTVKGTVNTTITYTIPQPPQPGKPRMEFGPLMYSNSKQINTMPGQATPITRQGMGFFVGKDAWTVKAGFEGGRYNATTFGVRELGSKDVSFTNFDGTTQSATMPLIANLSIDQAMRYKMHPFIDLSGKWAKNGWTFTGATNGMYGSNSQRITADLGLSRRINDGLTLSLGGGYYWMRDKIKTSYTYRPEAAKTGFEDQILRDSVLRRLDLEIKPDSLLTIDTLMQMQVDTIWRDSSWVVTGDSSYTAYKDSTYTVPWDSTVVNLVPWEKVDTVINTIQVPQTDTIVTPNTTTTMQDSSYWNYTTVQDTVGYSAYWQWEEQCDPVIDTVPIYRCECCPSPHWVLAGYQLVPTGEVICFDTMMLYEYPILGPVTDSTWTTVQVPNTTTTYDTSLVTTYVPVQDTSYVTTTGVDSVLTHLSGVDTFTVSVPYTVHVQTNDTLTSKVIDRIETTEVPVLDPNGNPVTVEKWVPKVDNNGNQIYTAGPEKIVELPIIASKQKSADYRLELETLDLTAGPHMTDKGWKANVGGQAGNFVFQVNGGAGVVQAPDISYTGTADFREKTSYSGQDFASWANPNAVNDTYQYNSDGEIIGVNQGDDTVVQGGSFNQETLTQEKLAASGGLTGKTTYRQIGVRGAYMMKGISLGASFNTRTSEYQASLTRNFDGVTNVTQYNNVTREHTAGVHSTFPVPLGLKNIEVTGNAALGFNWGDGNYTQQNNTGRVNGQLSLVFRPKAKAKPVPPKTGTATSSRTYFYAPEPVAEPEHK